MIKNILVLTILSVFIGAALAAETEDVTVDFSAEPDPMVGTPTALTFTFKDPGTGELLKDLQVAVDIVIVEDGLSMFNGNFYVPDGRLGLTYHFQDATEHSINLLISPAAGSSGQFTQVSKTYLVEVTVPEPPTKVWFKTLVFLVGLMVVGIAVGYFTVRFRAADAS